MTRTEHALAASALLAVAACSAVEPGPPRPEAVEPGFGYAGAATAVVIRGEAFSLRPEQDLGGERSRLDAGFRAWLGGTELVGVRWLDARHLGATVPAGAAPGRHELVVEGPLGRGALADAFEVVAGGPPALAVALDVPARVSVGQRFEISARVENRGDAALLDVAPELALGSDAVALVLPAGGDPVALAPGESLARTWTAEALASGPASISASARGVDPRPPAPVPVEASAGAALLVEAAARLEPDLVASPEPVNEGQELVVRMGVRNVGEAAALDVVPGSLRWSGDGAAVLASGPAPASASIPGGAEAWFEWRLAAQGAGSLVLGADAAGVDGNSGAAATASARSPAVHVQRPASLAARIVSAPGRVNLGQLVRVEVELANGGDATARGLAAELSVAPPSAGKPGPASPTLELAGRASARVTRELTAAALGTAKVEAAAIATDGTDGRALAATSAARDLIVERPAQLAATLALAPSLRLGTFGVTMTVENRGDAAADDVLPGPLSLAPGSGAAVTLLAAPAQPATIPGGGSAAFTWSFRADAPGSLRLAGEVAGTDRNDGAARRAQAISGAATVREPALVVATDPFSDGSPFAQVAAYRGAVYVGPSRTGTGLVRIAPDGSAPESLALAFTRDTEGGNTSSNAAPPYRSVGYTGCQPDSGADPCGPDDEDGRGFFTSVTFAGEEWLVLGGARSGGDLDYVYLSRSTASPLDFWYVDVSAKLGGAARGLSAALAAGDRLYLGFADTGASRPFALSLRTAPVAPGLDAAADRDVLDLAVSGSFKKTGGAFAGVTMIDAVAEFGGRLYLFDDVGCIVSNASVPSKEDFTPCSPAASAAYDQTRSVEPPRAYDLEPRQRAWPQVAAWRGRLYAIRNTYDGPQLWACDPGLGLDPAICEPGDWSLVAGDAADLTRFGQDTADAASLLVATPTHLWVGLDDPVRGVHVFRTAADRPGLASDFTGRSGCTAGTAGCEGFGGDGFGSPSVLARIFDAKAVSTADGATDLVLTAGDGSAPVRVVLLSD